MYETLLQLHATEMRNGPNDYSLIKKKTHQLFLYFSGGSYFNPMKHLLGSFSKEEAGA